MKRTVRSHRLPLLLAIAVCLAAAAAPLLAEEKTVALPKDFRSWTHTKSMVIPDKSHALYGFHNIYANDAALATLKGGGKKFPEGAAFVASFYDVVVEVGMTTQGKKLMDVFMEKDKSAAKTGDWLFAAFGPDGKAKEIDPVKDCFDCHALGAKGTDFVFHKYID